MHLRSLHARSLGALFLLLQLLTVGHLAAAVTPTVPAGYCNLPATPPSPTDGQAAFSDYAWRLFVALNWPAQSGTRGVPNCDAAFGSPGPVVWETFKTTEQLFLPNGTDPGPWNSTTASTPPAARALTFHSKAPDALKLPPSIRQAVGGWLIDVNSNPTYYDIAVNETSYDYVRANRYYDATIVNSAQQVTFPTGALEIKAAWRILDDPATAARFHTVQASVMTFDASGNPTGIYVSKIVGLVGFHIVYQATGFPQWIWATFEQVDNAPDAGATGTGQWSYFNANCSGDWCTPNTSPVAAGQPFGTPNQITRLSPIRPATAAANATWQAKLSGTPFSYYQLISPQWPSDPNDPGNPQGTPTPGTVANTVLESYIQPTSSCMDCHSTARTPNGATKTNYSFIFLFAQPSTPSASPSTKASQP